MEIWRPVVGWEDDYAVSNLGNVKRIRSTKFSKPKNSPLKPAVRGGYLTVCLTRHNKKSTTPVHRIVAEAFLGLRPYGMVINHKDGNRTNNTPDNLEYCTHSENVLHGFRVLGRKLKGHFANRGEANHSAKLTVDDVRAIRALHTLGVSRKQLAPMFNVSYPTVGNIVHRDTWRHLPDV